MPKSFSNTVLWIFSLLFLSACFGPQTPQEITQAFWKAVINGDSEKVVTYSTLNDVQQYDAFSRDWKGFQAEWGKVEIDQHEASVVTSFTDSVNPDAIKLKFVTYLVKQDGKWLVDYARTANGLSASSSLNNLFNQLNNLGRELSSQLKSASDELSARLQSMTEQLNEQMRELSSTLEKQMSSDLKYYTEELQQEMRQLADSIARALREQQERMNEEDRRRMNQAVADLHASGEKLAEPNMQAVTDSSKAVSTAWQKLDQLDDKLFRQYKQEWNTQGARIQASLQKLLDELAAEIKKQHE